MHYPLFDLLGTIFSVASTLLFLKPSKWAWPVGLVGMVINITLYFFKGIYGDMALESVYVILTLYGMYQWFLCGDTAKNMKVEMLKKSEWAPIFLFAIICFIVLHFFLKNYLNSTVPWMDAGTSTLCLLAEWMTCRKILENWFFWMVGDVFSTGLFIYKHLPMHALYHFCYIFICVIGYWRWRKISLTNELQQACIE